MTDCFTIPDLISSELLWHTRQNSKIQCSVVSTYLYIGMHNWIHTHLRTRAQGKRSRRRIVDVCANANVFVCLFSRTITFGRHNTQKLTSN